MDETQFKTLTNLLERLTLAVERLASAGQADEPNMVRPLSEYPTFDWASIGAQVVQRDADGPTHVRWGEYVWQRRSPQNKYGPAIWYNRTDGKNEDGSPRYLRLITFKPLSEVDELPSKVESALKEPPHPTPQSNQPPARVPLQPPPPAPPPAPLEPTPQRLQSPQTVQPGLTIPKPPGRGGPAQGVKSLDELLDKGTSLRYNLARPGVQAIYDLAGADLRKAESWLPYFAECKALGLNFGQAKQTLEQCGWDHRQALLTMRDEIKETMRAGAVAK